MFPHGEQEERGNKAVKAEGYKVVYENDIVVNIILAWMGAIGRSAYDGVTSPALLQDQVMIQSAELL